MDPSQLGAGEPSRSEVPSRCARVQDAPCPAAYPLVGRTEVKSKGTAAGCPSLSAKQFAARLLNDHRGHYSTGGRGGGGSGGAGRGGHSGEERHLGNCSSCWRG